MNSLLLFALLVVGLINFACSIIILRELGAAGIKVGFYELRWQIHKHLKTYKQIRNKRDGKPGPYYYGYLISLILLIGVVMVLLGRVLEGG